MPPGFIDDKARFGCKMDRSCNCFMPSGHEALQKVLPAPEGAREIRLLLNCPTA
ncbi:predicted protein [Plenodomus lingam JN3]|uniref:Predicted protein n=1 Tax=Leptosphaeria maculans (strain JN3 / isolate v23.1.3 / race Av1-4-5-6-7-8) TaxID=985895 RepID=E5R4Q4_LEPMJ|nr:predicted protein [Plenodomus lingam JN3]CBX92177.1 predicted protein [Plenodomus lingam JN3]